MLSEKQIKEIKSHLDKSENPIYFFDDDPDGLCAYLLLKKYAQKGKGVVVKGSAELNSVHLRKVNEYNPDRIFILDMPLVTQEFIDKINVPIIWIDHHMPVKRKGVNYYNPRIENLQHGQPTTYWAYKITKNNLWIATVGCIADWHFPEFIKEFSKKYPDILPSDIKEADKALFETDVGKLATIFSFLLKENITTINKNISILSKIENPYELLNQSTSRGKYLYKRYEKINKVYQKFLEKANNSTSTSQLLLFTYKYDKIGLTNDIANNLIYHNKDKIVIVARERDDRYVISLRSSKKPVLPMLQKAMQGLKAAGGGHELACGALVAAVDFNQFIFNLEAQLK